MFARRCCGIGMPTLTKYVFSGRQALMILIQEYVPYQPMTVFNTMCFNATM